MALYITREDVRVRLIGKVRFTDDEDDENKMNFRLLDRLINEAEGDVEHDLSARYAVPFVTVDNTAFKLLPERPTKEILRTLCELKAVIRVLETDFGRGGATNAENYKKQQSERYDAMLKKQLRKKGPEDDDTEQHGWYYPPLIGLALAVHNSEADDGYAGMVLSTSDGEGGFAAQRINNPSQSFYNAKINEDGTANQIPDKGI